MFFFFLFFNPPAEAARGPPAGCAAARAGREPGTLRRAPRLLAQPRASVLRAAGLREEPAIPPAARPDVRPGGGGGASFLSETYGIRQEFGPPRFKKTNKGKIVREGPPRAAGPPRCPPRSPRGRPGLPAGAEHEAGGDWGGLPRVVSGGLPCAGPRLTCSPPVSGRQGKESAAGVAAWWRRGPAGVIWGHPLATRHAPAEPRPAPARSVQAPKPRLGLNSTAQVPLWARALPPRSHLGSSRPGLGPRAGPV